MATYIRDLPEASLKDLTDRELLELTCRTVNQLKGLLVLQQERIDALEHWRWVLSGGIIVVGIMGGYILSRLP